MFDFFDKIIDFFQRLWDFFVNIVEALQTAVGMVTSAVQLPLVLVGYMPSIIGSCILVVVAFGVVKFVIGR